MEVGHTYKNGLLGQGTIELNQSRFTLFTSTRTCPPTLLYIH